jgi:acetyl-CoA C-acetyltransferase
MSIKDKVAIIGMGCTKFGENWDMGPDDMIIDAAHEAFEDAGIEAKDIQAAWLATQQWGDAGMPVAIALKLHEKPVTRVENFCASGSDAIRNACMGIASGMYDMVLAIGFEKLKDWGLRGLPENPGSAHPVLNQSSTGPGFFALSANRYMHKYGIDRTPLAHIAVKNHHNGNLNPKAHFHRELTLEQVLKAPMIAMPFGLFDCCTVADGAAAAVLCRADMARNFRDDYMLIKGVGLANSPRNNSPLHDYLGFPATVAAAKQAYEQAGIKKPFDEIDCAEVHDCFTWTEICIYEDLGFCDKGEGWRFAMDGTTSLEGKLPVNMDGGLKCFGHPVGASGIRMHYELWKQFQGKAGPRQIKNPKVGLTHTLGAVVSCVTVVGLP